MTTPTKKTSTDKLPPRIQHRVDMAHSLLDETELVAKKILSTDSLLFMCDMVEASYVHSPNGRTGTALRAIIEMANAYLEETDEPESEEQI